MATKPKPAVKSLDDFRKSHDKSYIIPERFRVGIKAMGPNGWMYLGDFMRENKINPPHGALYRDTFKANLLEVDGKMVICGSAKLATKLRETV